MDSSAPHADHRRSSHIQSPRLTSSHIQNWWTLQQAVPSALYSCTEPGLPPRLLLVIAIIKALKSGQCGNPFCSPQAFALDFPSLTDIQSSICKRRAWRLSRKSLFAARKHSISGGCELSDSQSRRRGSRPRVISQFGR